VGFKSDEIVLIIKDDSSPLKFKINELVDKYASSICIDVSIYNNPENIGFDNNLIDAFNVVETEYLMLLSDDDYLCTQSLNSLVRVIKEERFNVFLTPYTDRGKIRRLASGIYNYNTFPELIYNSILFSGLVFNVKVVKDLDLDYEFLGRCIYSQVYLASLIIFKDKKYGVLPTGVLYLGGDGENYFGLNASAVNSSILSDRRKLTSDLIYQSFLLETVNQISKKTNSSLNKMFRKEYNRRLIGYFFRVRSHGVSGYLTFMLVYLKSKNISFLPPFFLMLIILFVPAFFSYKIYDYGVKKLKKSG
jgi:hypothetical protein